MRILVLSSYPEKDSIHGDKTVGVASYNKNTLLAIKRAQPDMEIEVWAESLGQNEEYTDNDIYIRRFWKRGSILSIFSLFWQALGSTHTTILIPFEIMIFGGYVHAAMAILMTIFLRLSGKKTLIVIHQIVDDLSSLHGESLKTSVINFSASLLYLFLQAGAHKSVVFEEALRDRLPEKHKTLVIPHAVEAFSGISREDACKELQLDPNVKYALYFGYLSPYKGIDELVQLWKPSDKVKLVVAGGANINHAENNEYMGFVKSVQDTAHEKSIILTGYLGEEKIPLYYSIASVVILPYKLFMSSSGPLSIAFSFEKPVLMSEPLHPYFTSLDFQEAAQDAGIGPQDVFFSPDSFNEKLDHLLADPGKFEHFSRIMKEKRSWDAVGDLYIDLIRAK